MPERPRLFLVDGTALAYRSYFAFVRNPLINSKGQNTGAVFGFTSTLLRLLEGESPERLAVVFDSGAPTFRHAKFADYKATREKMPDEMAEQLPLIDRATELLGLPAMAVDGYEADDLIGTLALQAVGAGYDCFIVTGDKDFMQLVGPHVKLLDLKRREGEKEIIDADGVAAKFGVPPEKVIDVLGLMGDSSDNVPGVAGVGPKTALTLVQTYGSLEGALEHAAEVKGKRAREGLLGDRENALLSKELVTIDTQAPVQFDAGALARREVDPRAVLEFFDELEFTSLMGKVQLGAATDRGAYHTVDDPAAFAELLARLRKAREFVVDLETTSVNPMAAEIVGLSFAVREREAFYVPARTAGALVAQRGLFDQAGSPVDQVLDQLRPILEDPKVRKGGQNIKYDMIVLANHGVDLQGVAFDTMVESYVLDPSQRQHNLDLLALKHLNIRKIPTSDLLGKGKDQITMAEVPVEKVAAYACEDAEVTLRLHHLFAPQIDGLDFDRLYHEIEVPLIGVLVRMERRGVKVDLELLARLSAEFGETVDALAAEIHEMAGEEFNINSTQQLGVVLFETLKIQQGIKARVRRTKTGYGTSVAALEPFASHPIVQKLLEYRSLTKLKGTYVDAFPELVHPRTGKIHTSFNQTVTATGRLSSSEPNLQNIPIRTDLGRRIRAAFIPSTPDRRLITADYSQVELRVLAHLAGDPVLLDAFRRNQDIHRRTASEIFDVPLDDVPSNLRSRAKAINFGIIYGMGPQRLARDTGITLAEAKQFIEAYFQRYPDVKAFIDETVARAKDDGFVETLLGRRRPLPELRSTNQGTRSAAERIAVNTPIQGTAADLIKIAMIKIDQRLAAEHPQAWMILQVHDELVFDVPEPDVAPVEALIREEMESALTLDVPLRVDIATATTWAKA